jgi:hypothetical protein
MSPSAAESGGAGVLKTFVSWATGAKYLKLKVSRFIKISVRTSSPLVTVRRSRVSRMAVPVLIILDSRRIPGENVEPPFSLWMEIE